MKTLTIWRRVTGVLAAVLLAGSGVAQAGVTLADAVRSGDVAEVRRLLAQHADVNATAADGATALHWAVHRDDLEAATLLMGAGANVNAANIYGVTALQLACANANTAVVERLLKGGADPNVSLPSGETPLLAAARTGNVAAVQALLAAGAHVNSSEAVRGQTALMWAAAGGRADVVRTLVAAKADVSQVSFGGFNALLFAASSGSVETAQQLLAGGANVNQATRDGKTPLLIAAASAHPAMTDVLLARGADPSRADDGGFTPLHAAIWSHIGNVQMVKMLLAHNAPLEAVLRKAPPQLALYSLGPFAFGSLVGATPFTLAATQGDAAVMRVLADAGADPLKATANHSTPLMLAAGVGWQVGNSPVTLDAALEASTLALALGGDVNAANDAGLTALHGAANVGGDAIAQLLIERGATLDARDKKGRTPLYIAEHAQVSASLLVFKSTAAILRKAGAKDIDPESPTFFRQEVADGR